MSSRAIRNALMGVWRDDANNEAARIDQRAVSEPMLVCRSDSSSNCSKHPGWSTMLGCEWPAVVKLFELAVRLPRVLVDDNSRVKVKL